MNCADLYIQTRIFRFLFEQVWVVNSEPQPDTWVVNLNSWVVNEPLSAYKTLLKNDHRSCIPYIAGMRLHIHGWHSLFSIHDIFPGHSAIISTRKHVT